MQLSHEKEKGSYTPALQTLHSNSGASVCQLSSFEAGELWPRQIPSGPHGRRQNVAPLPCMTADQSSPCSPERTCNRHAGGAGEQTKELTFTLAQTQLFRLTRLWSQQIWNLVTRKDWWLIMEHCVLIQRFEKTWISQYFKNHECLISILITFILITLLSWLTCGWGVKPRCGHTYTWHLSISKHTAEIITWAVGFQ